MRTFELEGKTRRFWTIALRGKSLTVSHGKAGGKAQTSTRSFASPAAARREAGNQVREKVRKGYRERLPELPPPTLLQEALEGALVEDPDDLASHMAYADWLGEQADPHLQARGEFIRVQLALEDEGRPEGERRKLRARERELLDAHEHVWLGGLSPFLLDQPSPQAEPDALQVTYGYRRGWLDTLDAELYTVAFTRALAAAPAARLLRRLALRHDWFQEPGEYEPGKDIPQRASFPHLYALARSPHLGNVRILQLGSPPSPSEERDPFDNIYCDTQGEAAEQLIARMPRVEELHLFAHDIDTKKLFSLATLTRLRVLRAYHLVDYALDRLAKNPALASLTQLVCHPHAIVDEPSIRLPGVRALVRSPHLPALTHLGLRLSDMGDEGVREIVASGILRLLEVLDLRHGRITDEGARLLAGCPDLKHLRLLDLTNNCLTRAGVRALWQTGVRVVARNQWDPDQTDPEDEDGYLMAGDWE